MFRTIFLYALPPAAPRMERIPGFFPLLNSSCRLSVCALGLGPWTRTRTRTLWAHFTRKLQANRWNRKQQKTKEKKYIEGSKQCTDQRASSHPWAIVFIRFLHYQRQVEPVMIKAVEGLGPIIFQHFGHFQAILLHQVSVYI